jgi:hypothetical protein
MLALLALLAPTGEGGAKAARGRGCRRRADRARLADLPPATPGWTAEAHRRRRKNIRRSARRVAPDRRIPGKTII